MCYGCFVGHWEEQEGRLAQKFVIELPGERRDAIKQFLHLFLNHSEIKNQPRDNIWAGGAGGLHACIDDDNYDCDAYRELQPFTEEDAVVADAWDALDEDERSIVVCIIHRYYEHPEQHGLALALSSW